MHHHIPQASIWLALSMLSGGVIVSGAWSDRTAGLPPVEVISAKTMGGDENKQMILEDELGRLLVGSRALLVFDGQFWSAHAKPSEYAINAMAPGRDGIVWAGATNEVGFFQEQPLGVFQYHSLVPYLPKGMSEVGVVWGCAPLGAITYFICDNKLLRWDGRAFQVTPLPTKVRLAPLKVGDEYWVQHLETGLYRLTEAGLELKFPASDLPAPLVIALFRDETGLVTVSNEGLVRPGAAAPMSPPRLRNYLTQHRVSSFGRLPDGNLAIGTLTGGLVLTNPSGEVIRIWSGSNSGLPGNSIHGLRVDSSGQVLGATPTEIVHFPVTGQATVFNALNGLKGRVVNDLRFVNSTLYAATGDGTYELLARDGESASFEPVGALPGRYFHILPHRNGAFMSRFGGVDWFDGTTKRPVYEIAANATTFVQPAKKKPQTFYAAERKGLALLTERPDGSYERDFFLELSDLCISLHEDSSGRLWIGTVSRGAFVYDPATRDLTAVRDPGGQLLKGLVWVLGDAERMLLFGSGRVFQAAVDGRDLRELSGIPAVNPSVVTYLPGGGDVFVAYRRPAGRSGPLHGAGILSFARDGTPGWRELDLAALGAIGSIRTATFTEENRRPILWLGGMEGIMRLNFDEIPVLQPPATPLIRVAGSPAAAPPEGAVLQYPFKDHQVRFRVFTRNYLQSKDWLFQSRLGTGAGERAWSAPLPRRAFDFTDLSEGDYRFEVRAVNAAGMTSAPATLVFRILPPWYRSTWAYAGYAVALGLATYGFIRVRERRIRARNDELESLVNVRTAELVKASAAKDEFLAGISHEIRNPMNGVIGISENFRTEGLDPESRRKFNLLRQCASHLSSLLEDILDFSKVQAGAIELDPKPFDLPELVESVAGITRADSEKYGIPVELAVSPAVPRQLVGDARRIRQILINFVSNALKFSGRGQVSVTVWCKEAGTGRTEVIFAVSDEGPGISPEEQARLFTRFERGAAAQKGRVPGTGLGLALCKGLAEQMGGRIWLESELGRGSCFYFSAPFEIVETPAEAVPSAPPAPAGSLRLALVVDDQEYNRIVLADLLQAMDFTVHSTQEGQAALDLAARQAFDVIFLDFNLPGLSGVDVARSIRSRPGPSAHALILATTAFTTPEKRAQCLDAGMDAFLGKPVTRERLVKALSSLAPAAPAASPAPAHAPKKPDGPADPLGNLRLLARRKGVSLANELALYFSELDAELAQLDAAIDAENPDDAGRFSHMLCGRCSFIFELELEQVQRKIEAAVGATQWADARRNRAEFGTLLAAARVRLASSDSGAAPPA